MAKTFLKTVSKSLTSNKEIVFTKEDTDTGDLISKLRTILNRNQDSDRYEEFKRKLRLIEIGYKGEQNVVFELKNSFIPMYVIQDLRIESNGLSAQIDFLLVTNKFICILETKKLNGNITINSDGDFERHFKNRDGKTYKKEGMYSPIVQNNRHKRILTDILKKNKIIKHFPVYSLVVIANPKSIIKYNYTPKEIRNSIIKLDQLTRVLNKYLSNEELPKLSKLLVEKIATNTASLNVCKENSFISQFRNGLEDQSGEIVKKVEAIKNEEGEELVKEISSDDESLINSQRDKLKEYRIQCSREEKVKAYMIFNNNTLEDILEKQPSTPEELLSIKGFGKVKVEKYGKRIINIISENR